MIVHKISNALLYEAAQLSQRFMAMNEYKHKNDLDDKYQEQARLLALQESHRLLRNYNYMKDTEEINQFLHHEKIKELNLLKAATVTGIFIDRYV